MNPFGVAITDDTLKSMFRYQGKKITQVDRAREAMRFIHADGKNVDALDFAWKSKERYGNGVSALVLVYNATGSSVTMEQRQDWLGYMYSTPTLPRTIQNGQWIAFLHVKPPAQALGSEAARVFRGHDVDGKTRDFMVAWRIPHGNVPTSAYSEIGDANHFSSRWGTMRTKLQSARRITRTEDPTSNCVSTVSIGGCTTSDFIAVLQHKFEPLPDEL